MAACALALQGGAVFEKTTRESTGPLADTSEHPAGAAPARNKNEPRRTGGEDAEAVGGGEGSGSASRRGGRRMVLFMVHTRAIRDAAYSKFQRHFAAGGFSQAAFVNVSEHAGPGCCILRLRFPCTRMYVCTYMYR